MRQKLSQSLGSWCLGTQAAVAVVRRPAGSRAQVSRRMPRARLGLDATGPASPAAAATLVVPMICVPIRRHVRVIGAVDSHRASQPACSAGRGTKRASHDIK